MPSENQSCLRFSVEESVWFQKGQEVSDLLSISLDPDIVIQEHDQYVSIKGALLLSGDYQSRTDDDDEEQENHYPQVRYVNEVRTKEDGTCQMRHRFPVDITIPKNRIQALDDVYVAVETFDYELPQRGLLKLVADLSISGIYGDQQSVPSVHEEVEEEELVELGYRNSDVSTISNYEESVNYEYEEHEESENNETSSDEDVVASEETEEDLYSPFEVEARKEVYHETDVDSEEELNFYQPSPQVEMKGRVENIADYQTSPSVTAVEEESSTAYQDDEGEEKAGKRDGNALYLTKIFAKEQDDDFTRMKICIVQHGDSLDTLTDRYDVSLQQLLRVNKLEHDADVYEGQLLYIPVK
ncbi:stage VI sporulation protein D [Bacillus timonensis]|nr:stage VI sporulation protein D [Bacillus timonensis]